MVGDCIGGEVFDGGDEWMYDVFCGGGVVGWG